MLGSGGRGLDLATAVDAVIEAVILSPDFFSDGRVLVSNYQGSRRTSMWRRGRGCRLTCGSRTSPIRYVRRSAKRVLMQVGEEVDERNLGARHPEGWKAPSAGRSVMGPSSAGRAARIWFNLRSGNFDAPLYVVRRRLRTP